MRLPLRPRKHLLRRRRPARVAERYLCHLASDSLGREMLNDVEREAERAAFVDQMQAMQSISTSEFPGMPPAAAMVVRTPGSGPNLPRKTSFMPA